LSEHRVSLADILQPYAGRKGVLLEVLHRVQEEYGYVPQEAMQPIADLLQMHPSTVYGSLTFYTEFRTSPPPPVQIDMCLGPTCHINGAEVVRDVLHHRLGLDAAGGSPDNSCGVHVIQCAGHCQHSPLVYVNKSLRRAVSVVDAVAIADEVNEMRPVTS
jgi:NADH:ubiquinone oxidoreductase subunit E